MDGRQLSPFPMFHRIRDSHGGQDRYVHKGTVSRMPNCISGIAPAWCDRAEGTLDFYPLTVQ
ncbi:hypothetical protein O1M63_37145 [Streptomyces mirabilis]|nr:hypothetical protein [Streptomyces mirabilis]